MTWAAPAHRTYAHTSVLLMLTESQQNNSVIFTELKFVAYPGSQTDSTPWF